MNNQLKWYDPKQILREYENGKQYKTAIGTRGLYEQNKINERFMVGDQWHGAKCGSDRPLVRHNVIKRIGDYKISVVGGTPVTVNYSAEGVPNTLDIKEEVRSTKEQIAKFGETLPFTENEMPTSKEVNLVMDALSDYFKVTAERVKFQDVKEQALRDSFVTGTGIVYTYWDDSIKTGLYADENRTTPIIGDISCEVLDVENVYFGDPSQYDLQKQPFIILAQRKSVAEIRRIMRKHHRPAEDIDNIKGDKDYQYESGEYGSVEVEDSQKAILLTKLHRVWESDGANSHIEAVMTSCGVTVRATWNIGIRLYPLAKFCWERRKNCAYGESEITYLIPNQIAINRMITASVWALMMMGMPILIVNGDLVQQPITNEPGQIIKVNGGINDVQMAMRYLNPPNFSPNFDNNISSLIANTLTQSGATDSALGDVNPENTSAIIAVREAATMPMQTMQNRFYSFLEDVARIWAEFWVTQYGERSLKVEDESGTWYFPFDGNRYKDFLISAKIDVGTSTLWSESQSVRTLDNLFERQVIDVLQYLQRLPKGTVPDVSGLIREIQKANQAAAAQSNVPTAPTAEEVLGGLSDEERMAYNNLPPEEQAEMMRVAMNNAGGD